jgi:hypothetical protein
MHISFSVCRIISSKLKFNLGVSYFKKTNGLVVSPECDHGARLEHALELADFGLGNVGAPNSFDVADIVNIAWNGKEPRIV